MAEQIPRKLAVILHADVVSSTALVQRNESVAHERIRDAFLRFSATIESYGGIAHEIRGDALVAEFARASDAVSAALAFQSANTAHNQDLTDDIRPEIRTGISLGEVVIADGTLTGAGVVLAQRLEQLAEPGGVVVQGSVAETVPTRMPFEFEELGARELKGFDQPVRTLAAYLRSGEQVPEPESVGVTEVHSAPVGDEVARLALELPDKPSIAVLPFDNMSGDPEQGYFSDGITEDIITEFSRFRTLFVVARNSSFAFREKGVDVAEVSRKLGVQYIVEGSVRKAADTVRVTVQLIDARSGHQLWAERYDRELRNIFAVQDEITQSIVSILPGRLEDAGWERAQRKRTANMTAYDYLLLGLERFKRNKPEQNVEARQMLRKAIDLDPQYARAHALLASTYVFDVYMEIPTEQTLDETRRVLETALTLDDEDAWSHAMLGALQFIRKQDAEAEIEFQRALALNSNDADATSLWANILVYLGRWDEALEWIIKAKRLNPFPPPWYHWYQGLALFSGHEYEPAVRVFKEMRPLFRSGHGYIAACYAYLNRSDEAHAEMARFMDASKRERPDLGEPGGPAILDLVLERADRYRNPSDRDHFLEGLRKAGLPE